MENKFQSQVTRVGKRVQDLKDAKRADSPDAGGIGTNTFVYDQLLAINEDLMSLYQNLNQVIDLAANIPGKIADAQRRRPSGR
jgi:hypothetical protein